MIKNISILSPESEFTQDQLVKLQFAGKVSFSDSKRESSLKDLIKMSKEADIIAFDPSGYNKYASRYLSEILRASPKVKGLALNSINDNCVDKQYCEERGISVTVVPNPAVEAVAEYALFLLLGAARRVFINGWQAQKKMYRWEFGSELWGKKLGIIGMNHVGERLAGLAKAFGMTLCIWDKDIVRFEGANRQSSVESVIHRSDMVVILLPDIQENKKIITKQRIALLEKWAVVVNLSGRDLVDEREMAKALQNGMVDQYIFEAEKLKPSPLDKIEHAIVFKKLSGHTRESASRSRSAWVKNISDMTGHYSS